MSLAWKAPSARSPQVRRTQMPGSERRRQPGRSQPARRRPRPRPVTAVAVFLVAAGVGAGAAYGFGATPLARLPGSPAPSVSRTSPPPPAGGLVTLAPAAALRPDAGLIGPVITRYFQAINHRDYAGYLATQSPGQALTGPQFQSAFRSTQDSGVLVTSIATWPGDRPVADITFTSRQQPHDGPGGESCTKWHLMLFFDNRAGTYTIGAPPNGYKTSYQACS